MKKFDKFEVMATYEGKSRDYCDIQIWDGHDQKTIVPNVPFFDKSGREISYDEAFEIYGFDGLSQDIWGDEDYIKYVKAYAEKHADEE